MNVRLLCVPLAFLASAASADDALQRRQRDLAVLRRLLPATNTRITGRINAHDRSWEEWVQRTGELPPDFAAMPARAALPDPLEGVRTVADWDRKKPQIRADFERWVFGRLPAAPTDLTATTTGEWREGGVTVRDVVLRWKSGAATLRMQLLIPPGPGPFPVFLTNHPRSRPWVATAVRRGYLGAIYFAADPIYGNDDDSDKWIELYPDHDWSCLARWAWAGMRAVDHLVTLPQVNRRQIAIAGHSRNGKQALIAAALDERIGAVVASSGNTGETNPWRYTTDPFANESIEQITGSFPHWFHPRLRFFASREHQLPVDQNLLLAMVAPRGLLMASAWSEGQGAPWGIEQAYRSVRGVYRLHGKEPALGLSLRPGEHATTAEDIERYADFLDGVFDRAPALAPPVERMNAYDRWQRRGGTVPPPPAASAPLAERLRWALGEAPPEVAFPARTETAGSARTSDGWLEGLYARPYRSPAMDAVPLSFGDDLKGDLYLPKGRSGRLPAVVWLHPYSYATGYSRYARPFFEQLTQKGFAVLAFDQIGFGARLPQGERFYDRYPHWSLMGKMVADTRAAVAALAALDGIDPARIHLVGWSLGAKVGLYTAALEPRVAGLVAVGGVGSVRVADPAVEGLRELTTLHGLEPRLGAFHGREAQLPFDESDLLAALGTRPGLVIAPTLDRYHPPAEVHRVVTAARNAGATRLDTQTPEEFQRFTPAVQSLVLNWLAQR